MWWEIEPTGFNEPIASVGLGEVTHFEYVRMPIKDMGLSIKVTGKTRQAHRDDSSKAIYKVHKALHTYPHGVPIGDEQSRLYEGTTGTTL